MNKVFTHLTLVAAVLASSLTAMAQDDGPQLKFMFNVTGYHKVSGTNVTDADRTPENMVPVSLGFYDDMSMLVTMPKGDGKTDLLNGQACTANLYLDGETYSKDVAFGIPTAAAFHEWITAVYGGSRGNHLMYTSFNNEKCNPWPGVIFNVTVNSRKLNSKGGYNKNYNNSFNYVISPLQYNYKDQGQTYIQGAVASGKESTGMEAWDEVKSHFYIGPATSDDHSYGKKGAYIRFLSEKATLNKDVVLNDSIGAFTAAASENAVDYEKDIDDEATKDYTLQVYLPAGSQLVLQNGNGYKKIYAKQDIKWTVLLNNKGCKDLLDRLKTLQGTERYPLRGSLEALGVFNGSVSGFDLMKNFLSYFNGIIDVVAQSYDATNNKPGTVRMFFEFYDKNKDLDITGSNEDNKAPEGLTVEPTIANVSFSRSMPYDPEGWYTLCVPFSVDNEQLKEAFGDGVELRQFSSTVDGSTTTTFKFEPASEIKPGHPYLIRPSEDFEDFNFNEVFVVNKDDPSMMSEDKNENGFKFRGTRNFADEDIYAAYGDNVVFFGGEHGTDLMRPTKDGGKLLATRCYIVYPTVNTVAAKAKAINIDVDGEVTGIEGVRIDGNYVVPANTRIYNLRGQFVGTSLESLPKGIYIVSGKKVVK